METNGKFLVNFLFVRYATVMQIFDKKNKN